MFIIYFGVVSRLNYSLNLLNKQLRELVQINKQNGSNILIAKHLLKTTMILNELHVIDFAHVSNDPLDIAGLF